MLVEFIKMPLMLDLLSKTMDDTTCTAHDNSTDTLRIEYGYSSYSRVKQDGQSKGELESRYWKIRQGGILSKRDFATLKNDATATGQEQRRQPSNVRQCR
jgi:hypothetical protein